MEVDTPVEGERPESAPEPLAARSAGIIGGAVLPGIVGYLISGPVGALLGAAVGVAGSMAQENDPPAEHRRAS